MKRRLIMWVTALLVIALQPMPAMAYIDPNASGALFQLLAPFFAALLAGWVVMRKAVSQFLRNAWRRLTSKVRQ
ncbi:hypothetical protein LRS03_23880 [Rhizobacter sp. J219]|uniref:hypothetical protein n=1 Tax=Rhizobacter sp. J219 TaxID=2898430 RepID=UPI002150E910|nr:hypothetical protein [Rhizobacter sp. J219]MCR5885732.1 hypothetical protein [Rhizobacter sp. J219]